MSGTKILDQIEIKYKHNTNDTFFTVYIDVYDNSLSQKWLLALENLIDKNYYLEKNFCFLGFTKSLRNAEYICRQINNSIFAINQANLGYQIDNYFSVFNTIKPGVVSETTDGGKLVQEKMNLLHRYFEDLQGTSGNLSPYYNKADACTQWHIRQLNLLCHEYESLVLSMRKDIHAPMWKRPSQLMCWLNAPRFILSEEDYELFGIETLSRPLGGVFVGVNKAVGKHHWEVFHDEGRDSLVDQLVTTTLKSQTEAAGDFDIEWANNPGQYEWMKKELEDFKVWLIKNNFDPADKTLTIGHPQVGQVDLFRSFGSDDYRTIWAKLDDYLNVHEIKTSRTQAVYKYNWSDKDFIAQQVQIIQGK